MATTMERFLVTIDGTEYDIGLSRREDYCLVEYNGDGYRVSFDRLSGHKFLFRLNESSSEVDITRNNGTMSMFLDGKDMEIRVEPYHLAELRKRAKTAGDSGADKIIKAPMPGLVLRAEIGPGDTVKKGDSLLIIEAMKMENIIKSSFAGRIKRLFVSAGQAVNKNDKLIEFE
jgi:biotin carboxyl carrier protein